MKDLVYKDHTALDYAKMACDTLMKKFDAPDLPPKGRFHYHQGVFLSGMQKTYDICQEEKYYDYIKAWVDSIIKEDGTIETFDKGQLDDIQPSSRKYPYVDFKPDREIGNEVLTVTNLSKTIDGEKVLDNVSFTVGHDDKIAFVGSYGIAATTLFQILAGEMEPDEGDYKWGITTSNSYFPKDNTAYFDSNDTIVDWLMPFSPEKDATYVRGFLGRMLFKGDDGLKKVNVLSGGEKVRVMLSKMMMLGSNVLLMDEPTNHLDMESITSVNNGLIKFPGVVLFTSQDHQFIQTIANRIIEFTPNGMIDKVTTYDEYLDSDEMARKRQALS